MGGGGASDRGRVEGERDEIEVQIAVLEEGGHTL